MDNQSIWKKKKETQISENFLVIYTRSGYSHSVDRKAISSILNDRMKYSLSLGCNKTTRGLHLKANTSHISHAPSSRMPES